MTGCAQRAERILQRVSPVGGDVALRTQTAQL
jgi:hypothetical protein